MIGRGKYDDICTEARQKAKAEGVVLIVLGGYKGHGFSCQLTYEETRQLPAMLRTMATQIEADMRDAPTV